MHMKVSNCARCIVTCTRYLRHPQSIKVNAPMGILHLPKRPSLYRKRIRQYLAVNIGPLQIEYFVFQVFTVFLFVYFLDCNN